MKAVVLYDKADGSVEIRDVPPVRKACQSLPQTENCGLSILSLDKGPEDGRMRLRPCPRTKQQILVPAR